MKVLFVASGNSITGITPVVFNQGESLKGLITQLDYFTIKGKGLFSYLKHILILRKELEKNHYDLIHAHYGLCGIISSVANCRKKLVVSIMGDDINGSINRNGRSSVIGNILVLINRLFINRYDYIILKSSALAFKIKFKKKEIIPNGVNLNIFYELDKKKARNKIKIDCNVKLIIFVSDPNRPEKNYYLAKKSVSLVNIKGIKLLPVYGIPSTELKYYYNSADLLLLTSLQEGSPNVIKEAMACNCPIVSTDVGDVRWLIENTEGCYITSFKPEDIAHKIELALEFSEKVGRTKGRERILEFGLDSETVANKIINVYEKVLKEA